MTSNTNSNLIIESTQYGGFTSYGGGQVATHKSGITNQYRKDVYKDISQYKQREVDYFDDKSRYRSVYNQDYLKAIRQKDYANIALKPQMKIDLDKYQYDTSINQLMDEGKMKNEETVRNK